jgi:hypothetical protein
MVATGEWDKRKKQKDQKKRSVTEQTL